MSVTTAPDRRNSLCTAAPDFRVSAFETFSNVITIFVICADSCELYFQHHLHHDAATLATRLDLTSSSQPLLLHSERRRDKRRIGPDPSMRGTNSVAQLKNVADRREA
jgi:hypothetical protein